MVHVVDVHKSFGSLHAVRGVTFELRAGQVAGLLGPNGAGKTTTIRMITGSLNPDAGSVLIGGHDTIDSPTAARRRVGYLPETTPLYQEMKVREFLAYRLRLYGIARTFRRKAVEYAMDRCRVREVAERKIGVLSKGYRQRVGLAAALAHNPPVLILDEPTNGLDPTQIRETRELIRELAKDRTMLICSHILPEVERLCDRIIILAGGRVRADGTTTELTRLKGATYLVQAREPRTGDSERLLKMWQSLPHVTDVIGRRPTGSTPTSAAGWTEWVITTKAGSADIREHIWTAATEAGLQVREMRSETPTLENVFMQVLEESEREAHPPATGTQTPTQTPAVRGEAA
ncbi:MAG: hypothetical protein HBSAPP03_29070 [Phycisphaerae bacterium]|nr:MAG: hypothetical protein HBSAPP03_29070 [Phycisphaerae bacterium]